MQGPTKAIPYSAIVGGALVIISTLISWGVISPSSNKINDVESNVVKVEDNLTKKIERAESDIKLELRDNRATHDKIFDELKQQRQIINDNQLQILREIRRGRE